MKHNMKQRTNNINRQQRQQNDDNNGNNGNISTSKRILQQQQREQQHQKHQSPPLITKTITNNSSGNGGQKQQLHHYQQNKQQKKFSFPIVNKDMQKIMNDVIDSILKQRNTIILAKLAKENLLPKHYITSKPKTVTNNKQFQPSSLFFAEIQTPLMNKSLDQINHYYCTEISTKVVKKAVQYLKLNQLCAKVVSTGYIIDNLGSGFNFGGLTYWDYGSDGQKTVTRKLPQIGMLVGEGNNNNKGNQHQKQLHSNQPSSMMIQEQAQQHLQQHPYKQLQRESLLIVTVYLLKYEQSFRASNN